MKKLNKIQIKAERLMRNEELMILKGGSIDGCTYCLCNCKFIIEAWGGCYCSPEAITNDIDSHCGYGSGYCTCGGSC
jgi:hypothetical protein